ncbi:MAG: M1 family metallopeptidase [Chlorobi bacterium]|nr:M1 family metallopeptidase [Chlorobiota bacterium]
MKFKNLFLLFLILFLISCNTNRISLETSENYNNSINNPSVPNQKKICKEEALIQKYKGSNTKINDLINTELHISFNYSEKKAIGLANITLKPHFYPTDSLTLDAQEFGIKNISLKTDNSLIPLSYTYKNNKLRIKLNKTYTRNDTFIISISYTANPEKVKSGGSGAIHDNKGLYFIDTDTDNPQIWTQGETQSNSCWFPTIDSPNQKMTQDFYITVKNNFITLSNGKYINSVPNNNRTHTDYWKQSKPQAPYLAMIAAGKFSIIKNFWRNIPVNVYVQKNQINRAKKIFGKTDKMIEYYSRMLNYDFPWDKYSQIVVKNFVSGAMENTGAVVFGSYVLNFKNEQQRITNEAVVAHELSHHWFGDLVTCESWANIPLNESFATYFEYLWIEHEYGRFEADDHLADDYNMYNFERFFKNENLIRFYYKNRDDMFDAASYQKGGLILHMLRNTVGDDAFWKSLNLYLKQNAYKSVEIHNLRLAFEEITGEDMNWFFNEWFLNKGIPKLNINYAYNTETKTASIKIEQNQDLNNAPLYKIKTSVDIYYPDSVINKKITITKQNQTFNFRSEKKPLFINFDPDNAILCKKEENYTIAEYINILEKAPLYNDKIEAFNALKHNKSHKKNIICLKLTEHPYWKFRYKAIAGFAPDIETDTVLKNKFISQLREISKNDKNPKIKSLAEKKLQSLQ